MAATSQASKLAAQSHAAQPPQVPGIGLPQQGLPPGFNANLYNTLLGYYQTTQDPSAQLANLNAMFGLDQGQYDVQYGRVGSQLANQLAQYGLQEQGLQSQGRRLTVQEAEQLGMLGLTKGELEAQNKLLPAQQAEASRQQQGAYGAAGNFYSGEQAAQTGIFKGQQGLERLRMADALKREAMSEKQVKERYGWSEEDIKRAEKQLGLSEAMTKDRAQWSEQDITYAKSREGLTHEGQLLQIAMQQAGIPAQVLQQYFPYLFGAGTNAPQMNPTTGLPYGYEPGGDYNQVQGAPTKGTGQPGYEATPGLDLGGPPGQQVQGGGGGFGGQGASGGWDQNQWLSWLGQFFGSGF